MKKVIIYTDGGCRGNGKSANIGAYGVVMQYVNVDNKLVVREISKSFTNTTNNRMELLSVVVGLSALKCTCNVEIFSDSKK